MTQILSKMMMLFALAGVLVLQGCASVRIADLSIISTRNVSLERKDLDRMPSVRGIVGKDSKYTILGFSAGTPHLEEAIDDALDKGGGDLMIDVVIHRRSWSAVLFGQNAIEVKGTVIQTRGVEL